MGLSFSQRMGLTPVNNILQIDDMDMDLRNSLWNYCVKSFFNLVQANRYIMLEKIMTEFYKKRFIYINFNNVAIIIDEYYKFFTESKWYRVYDLLQFIVDGLDSGSRRFHIPKINEILEREMSGYRFISNTLVPISDKAELREVDEASNNLDAAIHINTAISLFADRKKPDYRNSIKESISAVEAICRKLTGKNTLGAALDYMKKKNLIDLNGEFESGIEKIYGYTNDSKTGIRHALLDSGNEPTFEDAKFMLVLCSAFVNYISAKAKK